jgi:polysaccharide export outer membrane protein
MWKKRTSRPNRSFALTCMAALLFGLPLAVLSQQTSPAVNSNIDESNALSSRKGSPANSSNLTPVPEGFENLKIGAGYLLQMDVYGVPEMSTQLRVDNKGNVSIPLIGDVYVANKSAFEAQHAIEKAFTDQEILKDPQVTLNIVQFTESSISVLGEVQTPGRIELLGPEPLGNVLARAGGETIAAGSDIEIQHAGSDGEIAAQHVHYEQGKEASPLHTSFVAPGDTVFVHRAGIVYVLGAVNRPGGYLMVNGGTLNVIQAISLASGETLQASTKWAVIVRREGNGFVQFKVPLKKMETGGATPVELQLNDALYVPTSGWKVALLNGSAIFGTAISAAIYRAP